MTRPEAIAALVQRKARAIGAQQYVHVCVTHALRQVEQGHSAHRAIRRGVMLAAELVDGGGING